ncbi:uncharacterized protein J3R85_009563 [Psidium guajava]|nr:uncharacterized protein J3R85_009563 [Psidium guajava]
MRKYMSCNRHLTLDAMSRCIRLTLRCTMHVYLETQHCPKGNSSSEGKRTLVESSRRISLPPLLFKGVLRACSLHQCKLSLLLLHSETLVVHWQRYQKPSTNARAATATMSSAIPATINALLLLALISLCNIVKQHFLRRAIKNKHNPFPLPPGPAPWPVVGCTLGMLRNKPVFRWIHRLMKEMYTEIACIRLGSTHVIAVTSPAMAREFLRKQDSSFASRPVTMASGTFGSGYLTTALSPYGEQWKKMRRVMVRRWYAPARHKWLHDKRAEEADNLVKYVFNLCKTSGHQVNLRTHYEALLWERGKEVGVQQEILGKGREDGGPTINARTTYRCNLQCTVLSLCILCF